MEYNRNKWIPILLVVLMLANIATLSIFWIFKTNEKRRGGPPGRGSAASAIIIKELQFDKPQQEAYQKLIEEHQLEVRDLRRELGPLKDQFFNSVKDSSMFGKALENAAAPLGEKEKQLDVLTFIHFRKVRDLCRPEQKVKFDKIIARVMRTIAQGPPHRPPGPPPNGERGMPPPPPEQ